MSFVCVHKRLYQDTPHSIHAHPLQNHKNGKNYNNSRGGIINNAKADGLRNAMWSLRYNSAVYNARLVSSLLQHGGNNVETVHSIILRKFRYLRYHEIHIGYVPYYTIIIKNAMNNKNTSSLIEDMKKYPDKHDVDRLTQIKAIQNSSLGVDAIRVMKLDKTNHGMLFWATIDRSAKTWLRGIFFSFHLFIFMIIIYKIIVFIYRI